jgi:hypothetical protein
MIMPDIDPFLRALPKAFEAEQPARAEVGWILLGVLLVAAVVICCATLRWVSRGGLRRTSVGRFSVR